MFYENQHEDEIELGKLIDSMKNIKERLYKLENNSDIDIDIDIKNNPDIDIDIDIDIKDNDNDTKNGISNVVTGSNTNNFGSIGIGSCVGISISKPKNIFFGSELPMYIVSDFYNKQLQTILESITNTLDKLNTRLENLENHRIDGGIFSISI